MEYFGQTQKSLTEDKDEQTKNLFYQRLKEEYERCSTHGVKIILDNFSAKIGKENTFSPTAGNSILQWNDTSQRQKKKHCSWQYQIQTYIHNVSSCWRHIKE